MNNKLQTLIAASVSGISAFVSWLVTLPPESQDAFLSPLVEITPLHWRPTVGFIFRALATISTVYAGYKASHSGPTTPPENKPDDK